MQQPLADIIDVYKPDTPLAQASTIPASWYIDLEPGSLLVMGYATQLHYTHGVPKTTAPVGERISLAFRVKPAQGAPADDAGSLYR